MLVRLACIIKCCLLTGVLNAQSSPVTYNPSKLFWSGAISPLTELMFMPVESYQRPASVPNSTGTGYRDTTLLGYNEFGAATLMAVTLEARRNLYTYRETASLSLAVPFGASLNFYETRRRNGSITLPLFLDLNYGMHSTWGNIDDFGARLGFGYQAIWGGILGSGLYGRYKSRIWTQPVIRGGVKFPFRSKLCYVDLYYGFFGKRLSYVSSIDSNGTPYYLSARERIYFKLTFGLLFNYED
jgi:hypothetical protein